MSAGRVSPEEDSFRSVNLRLIDSELAIYYPVKQPL